MFNDLQEDKLNKIFRRISELFALSMDLLLGKKNIVEIIIYLI